MIPPNLFYHKGNSEALEQVKSLRLAKVTSVNAGDMVVDIEYLEESGGRTRVPIPMPSAYPGGGIYCVPRKGALVLVGVRVMQSPVIVAFYPFNTFSPDSYNAIAKQVFGIPDQMSEGDILFRAASDSARCTVCGTTSLMTSWEINVDPTTLIERCPNTSCEAPAYVNDKSGKIIKTNKKQLGTTLHLQSDGTVFFQGDNLSSVENGDTSRLFKFVIDGVTGDVTVSDANDVNIFGGGQANLDFRSVAITADDTITESANSRSQNISTSSLEVALNRTIQATDTLLETANILSLKALSTMNVESLNRSVTIGDSDTYSVGTLVAYVDESRTVTIGSPDNPTPSNDTEIITGSKSVTVGADLAFTVTGNKSVVVTGDFSTTITKTGSISSVGAMTIASTGANLALNGTSVVLNGGTLAVARKTDATLIDNLTDSTFITFMSNLIVLLNDIVMQYNLHTHPVAGALAGSTTMQITALPVPTAPVTVTGKINGGNNTVKA